MNRAQLHHRFEEIYQGLNAEQRKAVDQIYGPVLVIAGPGTGKTQILSARIGKILLETDYLPENILCLTYTDAGRVAMRKRLQSMIGADAYRVHIHTFHSYCNQIIQENVGLFNRSSLDPVSDLERITFLHQLIDGFKEDNPLKRFRSDAYYESKRLQNLFAVMKQEGWSSSFIQQQVDDYISRLPSMERFIYKRAGKNKNGEYKKGDLKLQDIEGETQKMKLLWHAAAAFDAYQQIMSDHHRYDFDDMINWVIKALENHDYLLADQQEQFQFILVDEFQDTSGSQNKLVGLLSAYQEQPNVFVVGDDDQSIYRFQGANIENIESYRNKYANMLADIVLQSNYRSTPSILELSQSVIENNKTRLSSKYPHLIKHLLAANPKRVNSQQLPELRVYENTFQEMAGICAEIAGLIASGVDPQRIAVLYKENKWGDELMKFMKEKGIPFYSKRKEDLFQIAISKKLITILRYIAAERHIPFSGDEMLFKILHFDLFGIPATEIAKASIQVHDEKRSSKAKASLRTWLQDWKETVNPTLFESKPHDAMIRLSHLLEKWIKDSYNMTVIQLFENILLEGGFIGMALNDSSNKMWNLEVLRSLMDFVKEEMHRNPQQDLSGLVDTIDLMDSEKIRIPLYRLYGNEQGVNLLTIHGSKGLEFEYVFLMNTTTDAWSDKGKGNLGKYALPDNLFSEQKEENDINASEELRRLFFVALTRAEEHLYISWSKLDEKEKVQEPSKFVSEIQDKMPLGVRQMKVSEEDVVSLMHIYLLRETQPVIAPGEKELIQPLLDQFEMNATALNKYLRCPLEFYYNNLIRIPAGRSENAEFGSAIHHALEQLFERKKDLEQQMPEVESVIKDFERYMYNHRESFTREAYDRRLVYGKKVLNDLYNQYAPEWQRIDIYSVEKSISNVVYDGVPIKGKIDRMDYNGSFVTIVDYKTGNPESSSQKKLSPPSDGQPLGGDYWRQAIFYKILVENYKLKNYHVEKTFFHFVEADKSGNYLPESKSTIRATDQEVDIVKQQIKEAWTRIQNHEFYTGCGDANCEWCNFVKDNGLYTELQQKSLRDAEE
jgi:DNA helicase-2/ATP-dependent DNA helicase PcrA